MMLKEGQILTTMEEYHAIPVGAVIDWMGSSGLPVRIVSLPVYYERAQP